MAIKLSDAAIRNQDPVAGRQIDIRDSIVPGLALRVSPNGTKAFVVLYRVGRKARRLTLGRYSAITLAEARQKARQALRQVQEGKDPATEKQRARAEYDRKLFGALVPEFIERYAKPNTRSWRETERLLKREFADWNRRLIPDISRRDVNGVLAAIVKRGSPSSANHALAAVRQFFNWAVDEWHPNSSPCVGIRAPSKTKSRERILTTNELSKIWSAAEGMGFPYGTIIQLLILTGQRRSEVAGMRWIEVDFAQRLWAIPAKRTKTNRN